MNAITGRAVDKLDIMELMAEFDGQTGPVVRCPCCLGLAQPETFASSLPRRAVAGAIAGEHMADFVESGPDKLARRLFAHGAHFDEWPSGVANLPTVVIGDAAKMRLAGAINELGVIQYSLLFGGEP